MSKQKSSKLANSIYLMMYQTFSECYKSDHSLELQLQAAKRTYEGIWPEQHKHVPHLLFNNVSVNAIQLLINEISGLVCNWLGENRPKKCDP
jgi:hypothetical protein